MSLPISSIDVGDIVLINPNDTGRRPIQDMVGMVTAISGHQFTITLVNGSITTASSVKLLSSATDTLKAFTMKGVELVERTKTR